jgi:hypothetical protein
MEQGLKKSWFAKTLRRAAAKKYEKSHAGEQHGNPSADSQPERYSGAAACIL